ncbi:DUF1707 and DUF4190 domain-containing protein [Rugosimonospora africana]|nr:DUF1707 and DUF4190 domain-containing protein [Rugosimonospora africana]
MVMDPGFRTLASDAERQAVIERLHAATAEGRLTLEEFSERASRVYGSRTRAELATLIQDLPVDTFPPAAGMPVAGPPAPSSTLPLLALIFGVVSLPGDACTGLGGASGLAGIVLGIIGLRRIRRGTASGRAMAIIGIICGALGVAVPLAMMIVGLSVID